MPRIAKVLLIFQSPGKKSFSISTLPPLGILGIASSLEANGVATDVLDLTVPSIAHYDPKDYDIIGFSINISNVTKSLAEIRVLREQYPKKLLIAGGPLCMSNPEIFIHQGLLDAIFVCEGEQAVLEFVNSHNRAEIKGLYLKCDDTYIFTGPRPWITDLDSLPFPAHEKVNLTLYRSVPAREHPMSSLITSRGCPFHCIFCSHSMGTAWRGRSATNVVAEIEHQAINLGIREICIYDDNFTFDTPRTEQICELLADLGRPVRLQFTNGIRVDSLNTQMLEHLVRAGTWLIGLAPETGSPEIMRRIKKGFDHEKVIQIREDCRRLKLTTFGFFMIGFPFETLSTIRETIDFAKRLDCEIVEFNKVVPYSGTELSDTIIKTQGLLSLADGGRTSSYHDGDIATHHVGDLSSAEVRSLIQSAYREFYLRPKKMFDLITTFSFRDLVTLTRYAIATKNI